MSINDRTKAKNCGGDTIKVKVWVCLLCSNVKYRCSPCLQVMTHVVDALGPGKGPDLDGIALSMVDVATKVHSDDAVSQALRQCCSSGPQCVTSYRQHQSQVAGLGGGGFSWFACVFLLNEA